MAEHNPYERPAYPVLIVISGPSGVGKDTIARLLLAKQEAFSFVVTATTRIPRASEVNGRDYIFLSHDEFAEMIEGGELLEWAVVYNDYKGVPKQQIRDALDSNRDVIMRVDVQGAATIRKLLPDAIFIFLTAESEESLITRLRERKSETAEGLNLRIATAREEMKRLGEFDYCVVNTQGKQNEAVDRILAIVEAEHSRVKRNQIEL